MVNPESEDFQLNPKFLRHRVDRLWEQVDKIKENHDTLHTRANQLMHELNTLTRELDRVNKQLETAATKEDVNELSKKVATMIRANWTVFASIGAVFVLVLSFLLQQAYG